MKFSKVLLIIVKVILITVYSCVWFIFGFGLLLPAPWRLFRKRRYYHYDTSAEHLDYLDEEVWDGK